MQPPAYNAVNPRTSLQPASALVSLRPYPRDAAITHTPPQLDMAPAEKTKKVEWPAPVRAYVRRAFDPSNAIDGISHADMQEKCKETISYFAERGLHEAMDWTTYTLPQKLLWDERVEAQAVANGAHSTYVNGTDDPTNRHTPQNKKRKSQDGEELQADPNGNLPPWRSKTNNLASRITYTEGHAEKRHKKNALATSPSKFDQAELDKRRQRFQLSDGTKTAPWGSPRKDDDDMPTGPVVGTNLNLEKSYFRLTEPAKAETVRPLNILKKTLTMLREKWKSWEAAEKNYNYINNQFKSLRQDLTVQHIKNDFTVKVYETHARIALEKRDLGEYNQCQTQLKALHAQISGGHPAEFKAYRILYFVYTCNKTDMNDMLAELTPADKTQEFIKHALDVRSSLALGNYHKFFRLYLQAQNMGGHLMDMFLERERLVALANISKGYVEQSLPVSRLTKYSYMNVTLRFLTDELAFENDEDCREFIVSHGGQNIIEAKGDNQYVVKVRQAASEFERLRAGAFSKVDIKGQI
jgi:hypothetical protein